MTETDCVQWSRKFRAGLLDYDLRPNELRLALVLCEASFDAGEVKAPVNLRGWAVRLELRDGKGYRVDHSRRLFDELQALGIVAVNAAEAMFELRPDAGGWSRVRSLRTRQPAAGESSENSDDLPLRDVRELDEALSSDNRANALAAPVATKTSGPTTVGVDRSALFSELRVALQSGDKDKLAALAASSRQILSSDFSDRTSSSENSAEHSVPGPARALASSSSGVPKLELAKTPEKSAEAQAWLSSVDKHGDLRGRYGPQWLALCQAHPDYVLTKLRGALEDNRRRVARQEAGVFAVARPLAWLSRKAREEGRL